MSLKMILGDFLFGDRFFNLDLDLKFKRDKKLNWVSIF